MNTDTRPLRPAQVKLLERLRQGEIQVKYSRYDALPNVVYETHRVNYNHERRGYCCHNVPATMFRRLVDGGLIELFLTVPCTMHQPMSGTAELQYWHLSAAGKAVQS